MFSKRSRQPKSEFFGVFKNIFGNGSKPATKKINTCLSETFNIEKNSLKKKIKSSFSFRRVGSKKYDTKKTPERHQGSPALNPEFEDIDLTFNISSILKDTNTSSNTRKRLRFNVTQETDLEDMSLLMQDDTNDEQTRLVENEKQNNEFNDSDTDYYKKMKDSLLTRGKKAPFPKPKRLKSFKKSTDVEESCQTCEKGISENGRIFNEDQIKKWQNGHTDIYDNIFNSLLHPEQSICDNSELICILKKEDPTNSSSGKIVSEKKIKKNRYNPVGRTISGCGVVMLKEMASESRMSWCSITSC